MVCFVTKTNILVNRTVITSIILCLIKSNINSSISTQFLAQSYRLYSSLAFMERRGSCGTTNEPTIDTTERRTQQSFSRLTRFCFEGIGFHCHSNIDFCGDFQMNRKRVTNSTLNSNVCFISLFTEIFYKNTNNGNNFQF